MQAMNVKINEKNMESIEGRKKKRVIMSVIICICTYAYICIYNLKTKIIEKTNV